MRRRAFAAGAYARVVKRLTPQPPPATEAPVSSSVGCRDQSRLELATSQSDTDGTTARRSAYAAEVLAVDPGHAEATRIRDEARAMLDALRRSDRAEARKQLAAGDVRARRRCTRSRARHRSRVAERRRAVVAAVGGRSRARRRRAWHLGAPAGAAARAAHSRPQPATGPRRRPRRIGRRSCAAQIDARSCGGAPPPRCAGTGAAAPAPPPLPSPAPTVAEPRRPNRCPTPRRRRPVAATTAGASRRAAPHPAAKPTTTRDSPRRRRRRRGRSRPRISALFRSIKPNMSADEERRLQEGFRAVTSQRVERHHSVDRSPRRDATVVAAAPRRDRGGRPRSRRPKPSRR